MTAFEGTRAEEIRDLTRRRVELFGSAGTTGRFAASLKSISEDTAQEYEGMERGHESVHPLPVLLGHHGVARPAKQSSWEPRPGRSTPNWSSSAWPHGQKTCSR